MWPRRELGTRVGQAWLPGFGTWETTSSQPHIQKESRCFRRRVKRSLRGRERKRSVLLRIHRHVGPAVQPATPPSIAPCDPGPVGWFSTHRAMLTGALRVSAYLVHLLYRIGVYHDPVQDKQASEPLKAGWGSALVPHQQCVSTPSSARGPRTSGSLPRPTGGRGNRPFPTRGEPTWSIELGRVPPHTIFCGDGRTEAW